MYIIYRMKFTWHSMNQRHYEALINDCLSTSLRKVLIIKAKYHKELAKQYVNTISTTRTTLRNH